MLRHDDQREKMEKMRIRRDDDDHDVDHHDYLQEMRE